MKTTRMRLSVIGAMVIIALVSVVNAKAVVIYEAESLLQNPGVLGTTNSANAADNKYEVYTGWGPDGASGDVLLLSNGEALVEGDVPWLQVTGLSPNTGYDVTATLVYAGAPTSLDLRFSFLSAAEAVSAGAPALDLSKFLSQSGNVSYWNMGSPVTDGSGNLNIYLGRLTNEGGFTGWDQFSLSPSPVPEPSAIILLGLGGLLVWRKRAGSKR